MNQKPRRKRKQKSMAPELWESFYRHFPIPIFIEDVGRVMEFMEGLRSQGVDDLGAWLDANPNFFSKIWALIEVVDVNEQAVAWTGAKDGSELVKSLDRMMLPETLPSLRQLLIDLFDRQTFHICECVSCTLDGQIRHTINQALLPTPDDEHTLAFFTQTDITDFKHAEQDLRHSQEHYCSLVENAQDVILCHDLMGTITFINQAGLELTGLSRSEILGQDLGRLLPDMAPSGSRRRSLTHLGQVGGRTLFETQMVLGTGDVLEVEVKSSVLAGLEDPEGHPLLLALIRDISDRRAAERKQSQLEVQLKNTQKMESLGALAGGIAHDFNNLLVTIMGNTELLLGGRIKPQDMQNGLQLILQAATQAADLCRQMQTYAGQPLARTETGSLTSLLENMTRLLEVTVAGKAHIDFQLEQEQAEVDLDPGQIRQVIMNLVTNAAESLGEDGGEISVRTGTEDFSASELRRGLHPSLLAPGRYTFCEVKDSGSGMDSGTVQRLFDPFFTTKSGSRGLGMSSALGMIQSHNGGFLVESQLGVGTTVSFLLPIPDRQRARKKSRRTKAPDDLHLKLQGRTVLAVDEDAAVRSVGEGFLRRLGCQVLSASNGLDALKIFSDRHQDIDAVLLDLTMQGLDGVETCRRLRVIRPDLPVVFASGFAEEEVRQRVGEVGDFSFVAKPYRLAEIRRIMAEALDPAESSEE
jgi:two-component system cell cycle sensor histidine kinase/response regulator CckA